MSFFVANFGLEESSFHSRFSSCAALSCRPFQRTTRTRPTSTRPTSRLSRRCRSSTSTLTPSAPDSAPSTARTRSVCVFVWGALMRRVCLFRFPHMLCVTARFPRVADCCDAPYFTVFSLSLRPTRTTRARSSADPLAALSKPLTLSCLIRFLFLRNSFFIVSFFFFRTWLLLPDGCVSS